MTQGPLEGLTSTLGEGLTELSGFQQTRLTAQVLTEFQEQTGLNTGDYPGGTTFTLASGTFLGTVTGGQRLRILSGPGAGAEAVIASVPTASSLSLATQLLDASGSPVASFTGESWEVVNDPETVLPVESTLGFPSTQSFLIDGTPYLGRLVLDERVYYYQGVTLTSFTGIAYDDGTGTFRTGVIQDHQPLAQVDDFSRRTSAIDIYRRSFLVNFAEGEDLTDLARNLGIERPAALSDDTIFRETVKAAAYAPRGTIFALESVLDALLGAGNYEIFEDMTIASGGVGQGQMNNRNTVYFSKVGTSSDAENPFGKTWIDGYEDTLFAPLPADPTTLTPDALFDFTDPIANQSWVNRVAGGPFFSLTNFAFASSPVTRTQLLGIDGIEYRSHSGQFTTQMSALNNAPFSVSFFAQFLELPAAGTVQFLMGTGVGFNVGLDETGAVVGYHVASGPTTVEFRTTATIAPNEVAHILVAFDETSGTYTIVVNGVSQTSTALGAPSVVGPATLFYVGDEIGSLSPGGDAVVEGDWDLANLKIWARTLTPAEITAQLDEVNVAPTQLTITPDDVLNVASVQVAPESSRVLVAEGAGIASTNGTTVTGPAESFPSRVYPGDVLLLTSGPRQGFAATIDSVVSDTQVTVGNVLGFPNPSSASNGGLGGAFSGASFQVIRNESRFGYYLPEDERILKGGFVVPTWEFVENPSGSLPTVQAANVVYGPNLNVSTRGPTTPRRAVWRRRIALQPEDRFELEACFDVDSSNLALSTRGAFFGFSDGERYITASVAPTAAGTELQFGLSNLFTDLFLVGFTGIWSGQLGSIFVPGLNTLTIEKDGRGNVNLYRANLSGGGNPSPTIAALRSERELITSIPYIDFPLVSDWDATFGSSEYVVPATGGEIVFGGFTTTQQDFSTWKVMAWNHTPQRDWWNRQLTSPSVSGQTVTATGQFSAPDVGRRVAIKEFSVVNTDGGNSLGNWEITGQTANTATVVGPTRDNGSFTLLDDRRFIVSEGDLPFRWPDHVDHSIEILTGANAGTYVIEDILDPVTLQPFDAGPLGTSAFTSRAAIRLKGRSNVVRVASPASFVVGDIDVEWRLVPNFPVDASIEAEVVDAGSEAAGELTLPQTLPFQLGTLMRVYYSRVLSAYLFDPTVTNSLLTTSPLTYSLYPAYLYDPFGFVRTIVDVLTAAGVIPDFDSFYTDAAGPHIRS